MSGRQGKGRRSRKKQPQLQDQPTQDVQPDVSSLTLEEADASTISKSVAKLQPPRRPDSGGTRGKEIKLFANHFDFKFPSNLQVFMYDFELQPLSPDNKQRQLNRNECAKVMHAFVRTHLPQVQQYRYIYDGRRIAYFLDKLLKVGPNGFTERVTLPPVDGKPEACQYQVTVVPSRTPVRSFGDIQDYVDSGAPTAHLPVDVIRVVDILLKVTFVEKSMTPIGSRALFFPESVNLGNKAWVMHQGLFASLRPQWSVRLNLDSTQVACYASVNLADLLYQLGKTKLNLRDESIWERELPEPIRRDLARLVKTCRVSASHFKSPRQEGKTYSREFTIFDLRPSAVRSRIQLDGGGGGGSKTVQEYFSQQYGIELKWPDMPCVKVHATRDTLIPVELCRMLPHQRPPGRDKEIVQEMVAMAAVLPNKRREQTEERLRQLELDKSQYFREFGIRVDTNMLRLVGRVLQPPAIGFARNKSVQLQDPGKWSARDCTFLLPGNIKKWAFLNLDDQLRENADYPFFKMLCQQAAQNGIPLREDNHTYIDVRTTGEQAAPSADYIDGTLDRLKKAGVQFVLVVIGAGPRNEELYRALKISGDRRHGLMTQAVRSANVLKCNPQTVGNILMKVNGKLGGVNWRLESLLRDCNERGRSLIRESCMVFGADVTHPDKSCRAGGASQSIAAVVASMDVNFMRYASEVREQTTCKGAQTQAVNEIIYDMKEIVKQLLKKYHTINNGCKPNRLIFFRDGVSDGQYAEVLGHEVAAIQQACCEMAPGNEYQPGITFAIVAKRHHTRLFPDERGSDKNCPAGTVVDTEIVHKTEFNFYLLSHQGIKGTSRPALYHILWDDNKWSSDDFQQFSYYLCHAYMRCTRSVSVPAPAYYAHWAAFRARAWLGEGEGEGQLGERAREPAGASEIPTAYTSDDAMYYL